jgi:predicted dehydrogenase
MIGRMKSSHVGLVGCGKWGQYILRDLKSLGARVTVVARSPESRRRAAEHHADAMVGVSSELPAVDAIFIATQIPTHAVDIAAVLPRGVPIFCEKPLCDDVADVERLAGLAPDRLFVLDKWRYHPGVVEMARIARSGELGRPIGLVTKRLSSRSSHPESAALWVLGPHDLAIGIEVFGRLLPLQSASGEIHDGKVGSARARLADADVWQSAEWSDRSPERLRMARLSCEGGSATLDDAYADHLVVERPGKAPERRPIDTQWPLQIMLAGALTFLDGGPPLKTSMREAVWVVQTLAAIALEAR